MLRLSSFLILMTTVFMLFGNITSNAAKVYMCIDEANETVTMMDTNGHCLESESEVVFEQMKSDQVIPVARFSPNENCHAGGKIVELGFDQNGNEIADDFELTTKSQNCPIATEENQKFC